MYYPSFLKKHDTIGICSPSAGAGHSLKDYEKSIQVLKDRGYQVKETAHVRTDGLRSASGAIRAKELKQLFNDPTVNIVACSNGGDFLDEILPYVDFKTMKKHPKWLYGASDPTGILYPYTTGCDVATIYGLNASSYSKSKRLLPYVQDHLSLLEGKRVVQHSSTHFSGKENLIKNVQRFNQASRWKSTVGPLKVSGRCIGGCIDVLKDLIGTPFDHTQEFLKKYRKDGFVWYFDNYAQSAECFYRTLLQMKYAGWFKNTKAILIGRVLLDSSETGMTYPEAIEKALDGIPVLYQADIGHTTPCMTMVNGAIVHVAYNRGSATVSFSYR